MSLLSSELGKYIEHRSSTIPCLTTENPSRMELSNKDKKNRPMQQEDEYRIQMELKRYLRKETLPGGAQSDRSFYESEAARTPSSRGKQLLEDPRMWASRQISLHIVVTNAARLTHQQCTCSPRHYC